jgi:Tripartite tricarboxylate transporter TctB family
LIGGASMISARALELATAVLTGSFGVAVVVSSLDNGIGWSTAGVDAGTFPFLIGLVISLGSVVNLVRGFLQSHEITVSWLAFRRLTGLFVPAAVFIALIPLLGMYLASGGYMFASLVLKSRDALVRAVIISLATPLALYLVFERLFQVDLPHGALAATFGF